MTGIWIKICNKKFARLSCAVYIYNCQYVQKFPLPPRWGICLKFLKNCAQVNDMAHAYASTQTQIYRFSEHLPKKKNRLLFVKSSMWSHLYFRMIWHKLDIWLLWETYVNLLDRCLGMYSIIKKMRFHKKQHFIQPLSYLCWTVSYNSNVGSLLNDVYLNYTYILSFDSYFQEKTVDVHYKN